MLEVQKIAVQRAIRTLEAVKDHVQFSIEFDGKTYGNREMKPARTGKRNAPRYPYGATRKHYLPYFKDAKPGDVIAVPFGGFDGAVLASNISASCSHTYGKGNTTLHRNDKTGMVEVMITGMDNPDADMDQIEMFDDGPTGAN